jgi:hypothetical protein
MVTELFPLKLEFRGLSDEDPDEITIDSPDEDVDEDDDKDDLLKGDDDAAAAPDEAEPTE